MRSLFDQVRSVNALREAWQVIYENGRTSNSPSTRAEIAEFASGSYKNLQRISRQLREGKFQFDPSHGVAIKKKNNPSKKRPIVKSSVANRIVQRAILDVLQKIPEIKDKLGAGHNYGGIAGVGVPDAIRSAYSASLKNAYFIRTDIKAFFDNIPRHKATDIVTAITREPVFDELFVRATTTELDNLKALGGDAKLFPLEDTGVAQGSCLSPLLCNLLLHEFDERMNGRGITCVRYIDDFILFAPNRAKAFRALSSAQRYLKNMNLDIYNPLNSPEKAEHGDSDIGFSFLGCDVRWDKVRPSKDSWKRLFDRVKELFDHAIYMAGAPEMAIRERSSFADTIRSAALVIRGWGNTYAFCTDDRLMADIDRKLSDMLRTFNNRFRQTMRTLSPEDRRRALGLYLLADCLVEPSLRTLVDAEIRARRVSI